MKTEIKQDKKYKAVWIDEEIMDKLKNKLAYKSSICKLVEDLIIKYYLNEKENKQS